MADIADQVAEAAAQPGMTVSDYLATVVSSDLRLPLPPASEPANQPPLPLSA